MAERPDEAMTHIGGMASATEATPVTDIRGYACYGVRCGSGTGMMQDGRPYFRASYHAPAWVAWQCSASCREGCNGRENRSPSGGETTLLVVVSFSLPCQARDGTTRNPGFRCHHPQLAIPRGSADLQKNIL